MSLGIRPQSRRPVTLAGYVVAGLLGLLALIGWLAKIEVLTTVIPGTIGMAPNTAICLVILATASGLALNPDRLSRVFVAVAGLPIAGLGLATLIEYVTGSALGVDLVLPAPWDDPLQAAPGRMSILSAISFFASGLGLATVAMTPSRRPSILAIAAAVPLMIGALSIVGYLAGVDFFFWLPAGAGSAMAVAAALALFVWAISTLHWMWHVEPHRLGKLPYWAPLVASIGALVAVLMVHFLAMSGTSRSSVLTLVVGVLLAPLAWVATQRSGEAEAREADLMAASAELRRRADMLEHAHDAISIRDPGGRIVEWNPGAETCYGWRKDEVLGRDPDEFLETVYPEDPANVSAALAERGLWEGRLIQKTRAGRLVVMKSRRVKPPVHQPGAAQILEIADDVTVEEEARKVRDSLLSIVSHELRTPLNFIMGFASILADDPALPAGLKPQVDRILEGADRMAGIVTDLLDVTALQSGKLTLDPRPIDFAWLVHEVATSLKPVAAGKNIVIREAQSGLEEDVVCDDRRIGQALMKLVENAIKFAPAGTTVTIEARRTNGTVVAFVRDEGPCIAPEDEARIFEPFYQVDMSTTRHAGGTGLGLTIARALVEAHNGKIGVTREGGCTFWFQLPAKGTPGAGS